MFGPQVPLARLSGIKIMLKSLPRATILLTLISLLLPANHLFAESQPSNQDFLIASMGVGTAVGVELFAKNHLLPEEPRFSKPNSLDAKFRNDMYWGNEKQAIAKQWSDNLVYGVSLSSLVWGPLLAEDHRTAALINMEVFAANSIVTNIIKMSIARERPYHYYKTMSSEGPSDFASFVSGHSSVAFSQAVTNSILLSESYPEYGPEIWTTMLGFAGATAYLRVAGDMHYLSDIVVGAGLGSLIAWTITRYEQNRFKENNENPINIAVMFKIPLG